MHLPALILLATAVSSVTGVPTAHHVIHEKRDRAPANWEKRGRVPSSVVVPVRIGLAQSNLDKGHDELMKVSDPTSSEYGRHWTGQEIADFFAPSKEAVKSVIDWISSAGINHEGLEHSTSLGWIEFRAPIRDVEQLLKTEYYEYARPESDRATIACSEYSVPENLRGHIDFITPTLQFDTRPERPGAAQRRKREVAGPGQKATPHAKWYAGLKPGPILGPQPGGPVPEATGPLNCSHISPACLRKLYNIPIGTINKSTFGIIEFSPETFLQDDLNTFFTSKKYNDASVPVGTAPVFDGVDGGFLLPGENGFNIQGEPDLDLEYAMTLVYPQEVTLFQVGDNGEFSEYISLNNFLDALDKSYCTFEGGDSVRFDEQFPDPQGYNHKQQCGIYSPPATISVSYGFNEHDLTPRYEQRQCYEYMKLGLAGTSLFFGSGDEGVANFMGECINPANGKYNDGTSGRFVPSFPSGCLYVTSVGATQIPTGGTVTQPETACETVIFSGGGFSDVFSMPSYQSAAIANYYAKTPPPYTAVQYNNSMQVRGFPDVSANGAYYVVAIDGKFMLVFGTSAATPTFASVITLINNERAAKGKPSLGFLNPIFYQNPSMFNDITSGGNKGCGTPGFTAVPGWDPVTGLGTPNYTKMLQVLLNA